MYGEVLYVRPLYLVCTWVVVQERVTYLPSSTIPAISGAILYLGGGTGESDPLSQLNLPLHLCPQPVGHSNIFSFP